MNEKVLLLVSNCCCESVKTAKICESNCVEKRSRFRKHPPTKPKRARLSKS